MRAAVAAAKDMTGAELLGGDTCVKRQPMLNAF
jgi:hypothetical protein